MNIDQEDISKKSPMIALILCLLFGKLGAHRFYVGKYVTGVIYLLVGGTSIIFDIFGFGYAFLANIVYMLFMLVDIYALYSNTFTDGRGKVVMESDVLVYDSEAQRNQILFDRKLNKIIIILVGIAAYIAYMIISNYVL